MTPPNHSRFTARQVVELTHSGKLKVEDYARGLLSRMENQPDPWRYSDLDQVLAAARALDAVPADERGPLHGVAVGVKDIMYTRDMPTRHGSLLYEGEGGGGEWVGGDAWSAAEAGVVRALREMGALVVGKTTTTEFAVSTSGPITANPHNPAHTPGGSSSGSAAAVAAYHVPLALGTQTGGSIVRPASYCGVWGIKPTWNAITRDGVKIHSLTLDTVGFFARSPEDLSFVCSLLGLDDEPPLPFPPPAPSAHPLTGHVYGFVKTPIWDAEATPALVAVWERARAMLVAAGARVEDVELPDPFGQMWAWHRTIALGEGRGSFRAEMARGARLAAAGDTRQLVDPEVAEHYGDAAPTTRELTQALDGAAALRPEIDRIASGYTALVTPSTPGTAPPMDGRRWTGPAVCNKMWTLLHVPVVNVPAFTEDGLPLGLSLVGARYTEQKLLRAAADVGAVWGAKVGVDE